MLLIGAASSLIMPMVYCDGYRVVCDGYSLENDEAKRAR